MPSFVTHDYFAAEVLAHAPEELSALCRQYAGVYSWGAQGFDPLCYHYAPLGGPLSGCGRALHHIPPAPLLEALAKAADSDAACAWLLGLCTHYILDRTLSPLIRAVAHERLAPQHPGMAAERLENLCATDLDRAVAEECITAEPVLLPAYRLLQTAHAALRAPSQMLALCASHVTEGKVSAAMCARAMRDMRRVHETLFYGGDTAYDKLRASEADAPAGFPRSKCVPCRCPPTVPTEAAAYGMILAVCPVQPMHSSFWSVRKPRCRLSGKPFGWPAQRECRFLRKCLTGIFPVCQFPPLDKLCTARYHYFVTKL